MMFFEEAALRLTATARRTIACLAALGAILTSAQSVSAQSAFTLPAPPFELPMLPSPSGNWTVMVGIGGEYTPDFVGSKNSKFLPIPIFTIRRAGSIDAVRATAPALRYSTSAIFAPGLRSNTSPRARATNIPS